jgi:hypothetical protein
MTPQHPRIQTSIKLKRPPVLPVLPLRVWVDLCSQNSPQVSRWKPLEFAQIQAEDHFDDKIII